LRRYLALLLLIPYAAALYVRSLYLATIFPRTVKSEGRRRRASERDALP